MAQQEIHYGLDTTALWAGDEDFEGIDGEASEQRYAELLETRLQELYPKAEVTIETELSRERSWAHGFANDEDVIEGCRHADDELFNGGSWVVEADAA